MTVTEALARKAGELPLDRQLEVLDFVEFLAQKQGPNRPRRDPEGLLADHPSQLSLEDFAEARREAWQSFPRETPRSWH